MGIPRVIFANGGILVPVSNGGGPVGVAKVVLRVVEIPDRVVVERPDPVVEDEEVVCEEG